MPIYKCWYCKKFIEDKNDIYIHVINNVNRRFHISTNCYEHYDSKRKEEEELLKKKQEEFKKWSDLFEYVKKDILCYTPEMRMSTYTIGRLKELQNGGRYNKGAVPHGGYPCEVILVAFKLKRRDILDAFYRNCMEEETTKVNYAIAVISSTINDVYLRYLKNEKEKRRLLEPKEIVSKPVREVEYIKKSEVSSNDLFDDMW